MGASATDVWAVGLTNTLRHYDGTNWSLNWDGAFTSLQTNLWGVWGTSGSDVWAVGDVIIHYNGTRWSVPLTAPGTLVAVWGSSFTDVWAVGFDGLIMHGTPAK